MVDAGKPSANLWTNLKKAGWVGVEERRYICESPGELIKAAIIPTLPEDYQTWEYPLSFPFDRIRRPIKEGVDELVRVLEGEGIASPRLTAEVAGTGRMTRLIHSAVSPDTALRELMLPEPLAPIFLDISYDNLNHLDSAIVLAGILLDKNTPHARTVLLNRGCAITDILRAALHLEAAATGCFGAQPHQIKDAFDLGRAGNGALIALLGFSQCRLDLKQQAPDITPKAEDYMRGLIRRAEDVTPYPAGAYTNIALFFAIPEERYKDRTAESLEEQLHWDLVPRLTLDVQKEHRRRIVVKFLRVPSQAPIAEFFADTAVFIGGLPASTVINMLRTLSRAPQRRQEIQELIDLFNDAEENRGWPPVFRRGAEALLSED